MKVKYLINFLNTIEDKEQEVFVSNFDFSQSYELKKSVEIKSSDDTYMYPVGVNLLGDF